MAESWIKMRTDLAIDPKVISVANHLADSPEYQAWCGGVVAKRATICVVVASLLKVWETARAHGKVKENDIFLTHSPLSVIDDVTSVPGLGKAMAAAKWAKEEKGPAVRFPNCVKHIYSPDEIERMKAAARQRKLRRDKSVTEGVTRHGDVTSKSRLQEQYITEHISKEPPPPNARNGRGRSLMIWGWKVSEAELRDDSKLDVLFGAVVRCGLAEDTEEDRQRFAALLVNVRRQKADKGRVGLLTDILGRRIENKFVDQGADPFDWRSRPNEDDRDEGRRITKRLDGIGSATVIPRGTAEAESVREQDAALTESKAKLLAAYPEAAAPQNGKAAS